MTREELKGKQTRGTDYRAYNENGIGLGMIVENNGVITAHCVKWEPTEQNANAALYAEAHNVANRTGMWPEDLVAHAKELGQRVGLMMIEIDHQQRLRASCEKALENRDERVKELEDVAKACEQFVRVLGLDSQPAKELAENARTILNKKP